MTHKNSTGNWVVSRLFHIYSCGNTGVRSDIYKWRATIFLKIVHFSNLLRAMTNMDNKIIFILAVASIIFENVSIVTGAPMHKEVQLS